MQTLLIDNYDSYTHLIGYYCTVVNAQAPIIIQNDQYDIDAIKRMDFDNVILAPGPGSVAVDSDVGVSRLVLDYCFAKYVPLLGICLGHQLIADYFGITTLNAPQPCHGKVSQVTHFGGDFFAKIPALFEVVRYHSLIVEPFSGHDQLEVTAKTHDSDSLVMALKHRCSPIYGVQFHPESIGTEFGLQCFENFKTITMLSKQRINIGTRSL